MKTCFKCALVICIGDRYFSHFGKNNSVHTVVFLAWSSLFNANRIKEVTDILDSKKKKYQVKRVVIS